MSWHAPVPLLALPRELRDDIYDYLWQDSHFILLQHGLRHDLTFVPRGCSPPAEYPRYYPWLPLWLLTNKTILQEGLQHFIRWTRCTGVYIPSCEQRQQCTEQAGPCVCDDKCHAQRPNRLISTSMIRSVGPLDIGLRVSVKDNVASIIPMTSIPPANRPDRAIELLHHLRSASPNALKELDLRLQFPNLGAPFAPRPPRFAGGGFPTDKDWDTWTWAADLSWLADLGTALERVKVSISCPNLSGWTIPRLRSCVLGYATLQRAVIALAKSLTTSAASSDGGDAWYVKDSLVAEDNNMQYAWHVESTRAATPLEELRYDGLVWCFALDDQSLSFERVAEEGSVVTFRCHDLTETDGWAGSEPGSEESDASVVEPVPTEVIVDLSQRSCDVDLI